MNLLYLEENINTITIRFREGMGVESNTENLAYNDTEVYWKKYQRFFPEELRINEKNLPTEEWWDWNDYYIHLDRMSVINSTIKVILIHGAGGNGRLLAPYARMLQVMVTMWYPRISPLMVLVTLSH